MVFTWLLSLFFVYFNSNEWGYVGCLMGAFGAKFMLQGCSDEVFQPQGTYHTIINTVLGIAFMTFYDISLMPARSNDMAIQAMSKAWDMYEQAVKDIFDPSVVKVRFTHGQILDKLVEASSLGAEASKEPRFWRTPWRYALFQSVIQSCYVIRMHLCVMEAAAAKHGIDGAEKA